MWVGGLIVNMAAFLGVFLATIVIGLVVTWPDVPWAGLTVATILVAVVVPVLFHPFSRSIWAAIEMGMRPLEPEEEESARRWLSDQTR